MFNLKRRSKGEKKGITVRQRLYLERGEQTKSLWRLRVKTVFSRFAIHGTSKRLIYKIKIYLDGGFVPS